MGNERKKKNGSRERREDLVWIPIEKHFFTLLTIKKIKNCLH